MSAAVQPYLTGMEGAELRRDLSQFFTPAPLAERIWQWSLVPQSRRLTVLEPAAGRGALIRPMLECTDRPRPLRIVAYEVDPEHVRVLRDLAKRHPELEVRERDFLADPDPGRFDLCVENPPYEHDQDVTFILRALEVSTRTVALVRSAIEHGEGRWDGFTRHVQQLRKVNFVGRPQFGGPCSPKTDFKLLELYRRKRPLELGEATTTNQEWW